MTSEDEDRLRSSLERVIAGRTVSVVGNASSLMKGKHGALIDSGCVLRINAGIPIHDSAQGRKVDIHCFSNDRSLATNIRHRRRHWLMRRRAGFFDNALSIWMGLEERELCEDPRQLFYPLRLGHSLAEKLGARPSTGVSVLHMLSVLTRARVEIFGFDFKETATFYRKRENKGPHDWEGERRLVLSMIEREGWTIFP